MHQRLLSDRSGFTLIEIICVLVLLATLASFALARMVSLDQSASRQMLRSSLAELNNRENLTWCLVKLSPAGFVGRLPGAAYPDYEVRAIDEMGKIPINASAINEALLRQILDNLDYDELTASTVADSIMDWRDEVDLHGAEGAEDDYYRKLDRPYPCKDAPFDAIQELLLVRGVTRAMYYGRDGIPGLRDIFTTAHDRPNLTLRTVSDKVEWALCGDPERRGNRFGELDDRTQDQEVLDLQACLEGTSLRAPSV